MKRFFICYLWIFFWSFSFFGQVQNVDSKVFTFDVPAPQFQKPRKIWIYLPQNYEATSQKYPVIYMLDGQNLFDNQTAFAGEWQVDESLDQLKAKVIIVGIEHGNDLRLSELTPFSNEKYGGGSADLFLDFIIQNLKPQIDSKFRTKTNSKNTAIFGSSLGGLFAYYAVVKHPEVFSKAGVFSPSFWFSNQIYELTEHAPKIKAKIYLLCGDNESPDMVNEVNKMNYLLNVNRCSCLKLTKKVIVKNGQHNEKLWREQFQNAYLWLF